MEVAEGERKTNRMQSGGTNGLLGEIKKTRDLDHSFQELIKNDQIFTCEKHFAAEDVAICKYGI